MKKINTYIDQNKNRFLEELFALLRIPSISADSKYKKDVLSAAEYLKHHFQEIGMENAEVCETPGNPVVYADKIIDKNLPTVLVYGHYDVQPATPLDQWESDPFDPVIRKTDIHPQGAIFARGACDDKGQMFMHVKALETMLHTQSLPCNVKVIVEGEEEVGSVNLSWFVQHHLEKLQNDVILISDTSMIAKDIPSITTGLRGLSYMEIEVTGPNHDLHSGVYGGAVANPINVLAKLIASLQDKDNRITIPGFYDRVKEFSTAERQKMAAVPFDEQAYKKSLGIAEVQGEKGYTTRERASIRPTLDVNGIWGGYIEEGAKTVLPSKAYAKISMRLVPDQDWKEISELFKKHFEDIAPKSVEVKVTTHHGGEPYVTPIDGVAFQAASKAMEETFGKKPLPQFSGGSIPIVALFERELKSKVVLMGFGLNSDDIHSPNENYGVWNFFKGIETIPAFYKHFATLTKEEQ